MKIKKITILILILSVIVIFILGVLYEIDYRILTRQSIKYFSKVKIDYYGGKDLRIFETDIAFILTLIPITFYIISRKLALLSTKIMLAFLYFIGLVGFYCFYCYLESCFIGITISNPTYIKGVLMYHHGNVDYSTILLLTIISTFIISLLTKMIIRKVNGNV